MSTVIKHKDGRVLCEITEVDLREANLCGANLRGANLRGADLYGANLLGTNLLGADLRGADLYGANLREANLCGADLYGADLRRASLCGANLCGADLYGANLCGANLCAVSLGDDLVTTGERPFFQIGPIGSRLDMLQAWMTNQGAHITTGCFAGTLDEFRSTLAHTYTHGAHREEYDAALALIETHTKHWGRVK